MNKLKEMGFEKIPTEDGFTMYELNPSKLKPKTSEPGLRIVQHVNWQGKKYTMPFYGCDLKTDEGKEITIQNRFGGHSVTLPWFAAAVYDVIMGSERLGDQFASDHHAKGMDWFLEYFPDAYMVLLD